MHCHSSNQAEICAAAAGDRSGRLPLLFLFAKATGWLVVGIGLTLLAALKLVAPGFWADCPWMTYGRVVPAAQTALFYGFISQAGLGLALWWLARLGGVPVAQRWLIFTGGVLWNLGCLLGVLGILGGDGTGYALLSLPIYGAGLVWLGLLAIAIALFQTFARRQTTGIFPSQWLTLAGVLWFFWVLTIGIVLLHCVPQRGVMQLVTSTWAANNLLMLWLTPLGLAAICYFIPKLANRPLYSSPLAKTTFWILAIFGTGCGFHYGMPLPRWLPSVSVVCELLLLVAVLALALNLHRTVNGDYRAFGKSPVLFLMAAGALSWMFALLLQVVLSQQGIRDVLVFTWSASLKSQLLVLGFGVPVMIGALWHVVPRLAAAEWPCQTFFPLVLKAGVALGLVLFALGWLWAGNAQAGVLANTGAAFSDALIAAQPGHKTALAGLLLFCAGIAAFAVNALLLAVKCLRASCPCCANESAAPAAVEVAS